MLKKFTLLALVSVLLISTSCAGMKGGEDAAPSPFPLSGAENRAEAGRLNFSTPVTLEEIRAAFYAYSVVEIVKALHENNAANWDMILEKIAAGDKNWILYGGIYIAPGTDAGASTGMLLALAQGLSKNPEAVLGLEVSGLGMSMLDVCTLPFIEPEDEFIRSYGEETVAALRRVNKPYLLESKDVCLRRLQESLAVYEKMRAAEKRGK